MINSTDLTLNQEEKQELEKEKQDIILGIDTIKELIKNLKEKKKIIEENIAKAALLAEETERKFKINFNIQLENSDDSENIYYKDPTIKIELLENTEEIEQVKTYDNFEKLDDFTQLFTKKFEEIKNQYDKNSRNSLHTFRSKYKGISGGNIYLLNIDFDIYIYLKQKIDGQGKETGEATVDKFYFLMKKLNNNISNENKTDQEYLNDGQIVLEANNIVKYNIDISRLDSSIQDKINSYLNEIKGGRRKRRTRKNKRKTKKRKYSNKRKTKANRKTRR